MGGLSELAKDLQPGAPWNVLALWVSESPSDDIWRIQGRNYLRLEDVEHVSALPTNAVRELLDRYLHRSIATRGLILKCVLCARTSFYRLEDLGPGFRCERCRLVNEILRMNWKGGEEPQWFYAVDEVVYQGLTANIHVPVLALAALSKSTRSFLHMPEAVVHRPDHDDIEVDIWAVVDGRIVIGEAKKSDQLETSDRREKKRCAVAKVTWMANVVRPAT
jgi:hypothetical protein